MDLQLHEASTGFESFTGHVPLKILHVYKPSTLSTVMVVQDASQKQAFALKLYDPRFATQLRSKAKVKPFDAACNKAYEAFVRTDAAPTFLHKLRHDANFREPIFFGWGQAEEEVYLLSRCLKMYETECKVYNQLKDLQGSGIPRFIAKVILRTPGYSAENPMSQFYSVPGILLEYISGFALQDLPLGESPREKWQDICNEAVRLVRKCGHRDILNRDVSSRNILVSLRSSSNDNDYRVVLIDFALCYFRRPDQSDKSWRRAKSDQNEEGTLRDWMRFILGKVGFKLDSTPSLDNDEWSRKKGDPDEHD